MKIYHLPKLSCLAGLLLFWAGAALGASTTTTAATAGNPPDLATLRAWVAEMKVRERGPFKHIRWFCKDGAILEPVPYACETRGGGVQHGEWSEITRKVRGAGYPIANVLADITPEQVIGPRAIPDFLSFLLMEKFLIAFDDGWIFRRARTYRGSLQDFNEQASGTNILLAMLGDPVMRQRFTLLREAARLLPHGVSSNVLTQIRGLATNLAERDAAFVKIRDKIHVAPDASDAQLVRDYAASPKGQISLQEDYELLAARIDQAYLNKPLPAALDGLAKRVSNQQLAGQIGEFSTRLQRESSPQEQFRLSGDVLIFIRENLIDFGKPSVRLQALDVSLIAGVISFTASRALQEGLPEASRAERLAWVRGSARAAYGLGLLSHHELDQIDQSLKKLLTDIVPLQVYRTELQYLERPAGWAARRLAYHFGDAYEKLGQLDAMAAMYVPDRLRSSPMLFYADVLESLTEDAARLSGVQHTLFGRPVNAGLRRLNAGLARGTLYTEAEALLQPAGSPPAIWLVPETIADLPPVAGILTAEEGNALSHVQLLARNLGIPNVVVGRDLLDTLLTHQGQPIVLAASPGGVVRIEEDGPQWDAIFGRQAAASEPQAIQVDLEKLDLGARSPIPTSELRATDSGRRVGPKAAQVGELSRLYPGHVSPGLAIPFGIFKSVLDRPRSAGETQTMFAWMQNRYAEMDLLEAGERAAQVRQFLAEVRRWIGSQELGPELEAELRAAMQATFGADGSYGVFVRSDTNVEDLPGFTGAGLNKTVHNVVGFRNVLNAIREVWTSPFTDRAFSWRQGLMDKPEHVYASILLHQSVANNKSGVMITADPDTGDRRFLTIVTNYGVGGGVDGQAAETLRVNLETGAVRLLSSATDTRMRILLTGGGTALTEAPAPEQLLEPAELAQLIELANGLPEKYPQLLDAEGKAAPADIEFGFRDGTLMLFQIRPFLQSTAASQNQYLAKIDAAIQPTAGQPVRTVDLRKTPAQQRPAPPAPAPSPATDTGTAPARMPATMEAQ